MRTMSHPLATAYDRRNEGFRSPPLQRSHATNVATFARVWTEATRRVLLKRSEDIQHESVSSFGCLSPRHRLSRRVHSVCRPSEWHRNQYLGIG
jgi:hypothetical protein